jgi:N utilization substance protein B
MTENVKKERNEKSTNFRCGLRSMARFCAVQTVYRAIVTKSPSISSSVQTIDDDNGDNNTKNCNQIFITEEVVSSEMDDAFFNCLIKTLEDHLPQIDEVISKHLSNNWKIDRIDSVMKSILRLGITELLYLKDIPTNVVLNEYIEISKAFFEKSEVAFVNGLLDSVVAMP